MKTAMAALVALAALAAGRALADDKPKDDKKGLDGPWTVITAETNGTNLDPFTNAIFTFKGEKVTIQAGDESREGTVKIDTKKTPHTMDVSVTKGGGEGQTFHAIFEVKDDTLKIATGAEPGSPAPTDFKSKEGVLTFSLKRKTL